VGEIQPAENEALCVREKGYSQWFHPHSLATEKSKLAGEMMVREKVLSHEPNKIFNPLMQEDCQYCRGEICASLSTTGGGEKEIQRNSNELLSGRKKDLTSLAFPRRLLIANRRRK